MYDILEGQADTPFNTPFNMYVEGSYFGDSDVLGDLENEGRDGTAIVDAESNLFIITRKSLIEVLNKKQFKHTIAQEMKQIARERRIHHKNAIEELKLSNQHVSKRLLKKYRQKENQERERQKTKRLATGNGKLQPLLRKMTTIKKSLENIESESSITMSKEQSFDLKQLEQEFGENEQESSFKTESSL